MPRAPFIVTALAVAAAGVWVAALLIDPEPLATGPAAVLAADGTALTLVAVAGVLLARGRWSRYLLGALALGGLGLGIAMPLDGLTIAGIALSGAALAGAAGRWLVNSWLRHRPRTDGPPPSAVVLILALLALPAVAAAALPTGIEGVAWVIVATGPAVGLGLSRAWPAALWAARLALPALAVAAALTVRSPGGWLLAAVTLATGPLAWRREIRLAVSPLAPERGNPVPIPPELVPAPILEAAGYDEDGRPEGDAS